MPKTFLRLPAILIFGIYTLYSCVLMPLENYIFSDIILFQTLWGDVIDVLAHLFEVLGLAAILGAVIFARYRFPLRKLRPLLILCGGALLYKYVASVFAVGLLVNGIFRFPDDLYGILVSLLIEVAIVAFTLLLCHRLLEGTRKAENALSKAAAKLGKEHTPADDPLSFKRPFGLSNPLLCSAFWGMLAMLIIRSLSFIIEEIAFTAAGATFSAADIPVLLIYWLILFAAPCVSGYFLAVYYPVFAKWQENKKASATTTEKETDEDEA